MTTIPPDPAVFQSHVRVRRLQEQHAEVVERRGLVEQERVVRGVQEVERLLERRDHHPEERKRREGQAKAAITPKLTPRDRGE